MFNKVYEEIKKMIKENYNFFSVLIITFIICTIELPYHIEAPGGIINIEDRVEVENGYKSSGSLNMAYVSEYKATLPTMVLAKIKNDWNLIKRETNNENTTSEADYFRNHILLKEANQNAIEVAYQNAGLEIQKKNTEVYVTYVYEEADTDIEIKDKIIKVNNHFIESKEDLKTAISNVAIDNIIDIVVERDDKEIHKTAKLIQYNDSYILGIAVSELSDIEVTPDVEFNFNKSESGPSGGLMMTLAIYNALIEEDITKGKKIVGTGTINRNGIVGEIDGVEYKLKAAVKEDADIFLVPSGENYEKALQIKKEEKYSIEIVSISTFEEALEYLKNN